MTHLSKVAEETLKLCNVKHGDEVLLVSPYVHDQNHVEAWAIALANLGADFLRVTLPPMTKNGKLTDPYSPYIITAMDKASMLLQIHGPFAPGHLSKNLTPTLGLYNENALRILHSGLKWLDVTIRDPEVNLRRLFPSSQTIQRTRRGAEIFHGAETIRIASRTGTDLTLDKSRRKGSCQFGIADQPGRYDNYGVCATFCAPIEESANGTLVLSPGDYILGQGLIVSEPVEITFRDGYARKIEGGLTARMLERWLANWRDEQSYGVSHIGWGRIPLESAVWTESNYFTFADAEGYYGMMQIALGSNMFDTPLPNFGLGGKNTAVSHTDIECLNHDFYLDGEVIVKDGNIVHPECS